MAERKKGGAFFLTLFGLIGLLFIAILVMTYYFARKANPVMLDDQGRPRSLSNHSRGAFQSLGQAPRQSRLS